MRIILGELKKLFCVRYILCITAICTLFTAITALSSNTVLLPYTVSGGEGMKHRGYYEKGEYAAAQYRTYKWFTERFGTEVTDDTIAKMDSLTFPLMEKVISEGEAFRQLGISNVSEYDELLSRYTSFEEFKVAPQYDVAYYSEELYDSESDWDRILFLLSWANGSFEAHRIDPAIADSEVFGRYGVRSYDEYMRLVSGLSADDETYSELYAEYYSILRQNADDPAADPVLEEHWRFWLCRRVKYLYETAKADPLGLFKSENGYSWGKTHTQNIFAESGLSDGERIVSRAEQLGGSLYTMRSSDITFGFEHTAPFLAALGAAISMVLSGLYAVKDNRDNMAHILYSTRTGRKIAGIRLLTAAMASAVVSTVISAGVLVLSGLDIYCEFYGLPISSGITFEYYWLDINMWQYIELYIVFGYIVCAALSLISFSICSFFSGYIPAAAVCIPLCIGAAYLYSDPLRWLFSLPESFLQDIVILAGLALAAVIGAAIHIRKAHAERI